MKKGLLICITPFLVLTAVSQTISGTQEIFNLEKQLSGMYETLYSMDDSEKRDSLNDNILLLLEEALSTWDGFHYNWTGLNRIGKVKSSDDKLKILTWHLGKKNGEYEYYGLLSYDTDNKRKRNQSIANYHVIRLKDVSSIIQNPEIAELSHEKWYGAVYYDIKTLTSRGDTWYVLFGFDLNDDYSNKKLLEVITLAGKNNIRFGGNFINGEKKYNRVILEYSEKVAVTLNYDERLNMFVHDHLSPFEPIFKGNYRFYGPDGSFDSFRFDNGSFILQTDIDARNIR